MRSVLCWSLVGLGLLLAIQSNEARRKPHARRANEELQTDGGTPTQKGEFPFLVHFEVWDERYWAVQTITCSGTIIDEWHILTAAKCVKEFPFDETVSKLVNPGQVYFKYHCTDVHNWCDDLYAVTRIWAYKNASHYVGSKHDIAILRTQEKINFSWDRTNLDKIAYPLFWNCAKENANCTELSTTKVLTLVSWGYSNYYTFNSHMTKTNLVINEERFCRQNGRYDSNFMFCAGGRGREPCKDYGSPIIRKIGENEWFQEGIVSVESERCNETYGALFTKLRFYQNWIKGCLDESAWIAKNPSPDRPSNKYCKAEYTYNDSVWEIPRFYRKRSHKIRR